MRLSQLHIPSVVASILLVSLLISFTWENGTSYDDGGLGTLAFIVLIPIQLVGDMINLQPQLIGFVSVISLYFLDYFVAKKGSKSEA